jgi:hypothetical protein
MKPQMAPSARWNAKLAIATSTSSRVRSISAASALPSAAAAGSAPPPKLTIMVVARLTRLPRSFARSALSRPTKASSVKLASSPKVISRIRK